MATAPGQPAVVLDRAGPMPLLGFGTWQMTGARCQAAVRARPGGRLPPHRHRRHVPQRARGRPGRPRQRGPARAGVRHHQAAAGRRRPGAAHPRRQPAGAGHGLRRPVAGPLAAARPGPGPDLEGAPGRPRRGAGPRGRGQQLPHRPAGRADRGHRRGAPGQPDPVGTVAVRRRPAGRAPPARRRAGGLQPVQEHRPAPPGADRDRRPPRGDPRPGRAALAPRPRGGGDPQVGHPRADRQPISTSSASPSPPRSSRRIDGLSRTGRRR